MSINEFEKVILDTPRKRELESVKDFLEKENLQLDRKIDYTINIEKDGEIIGTGSFGKNVLKCFAIKDEYRGQGLSNIIVSELINEEYRRNNSRLFVFTKPKNENLFNSLGFYTLEKAEKAIVLENDKHGIERYCNELIDESIRFDVNARNYKKVAGLVMNCNPFTLGHQYLIERASKENEIVHLFVVNEDESIFPTEDRYKLVKEGIKEFKNVILHKGVDYIISNSTFPTYFLKSESDIVKSQAELDIKIFAKHIAKALGITRRYVGNEPFCKVTSVYNEVMKEVLPKHGIDLIEIDRKAIHGEEISASKVRALLKEDKIEDVRDLVPKTTFDFLLSDEGRRIINIIKNR
ncbi:MAG: [citrate (pro-3S)-lyase] ligase [Clostridium sp.]|uniref:[citrate (pro-3S)-lyase] ligase n=1 Tax=Clostridium sp. TaxID=1506 RepID=UPI003EE60606